MSEFNPEKLHVEFCDGIRPDTMEFPRTYTLTHSDSSGDLFLSIGRKYNHRQISGWYTRFMRDEVLAEWKYLPQYALNVHCHVSGGLVFGSARMRDGIFRQHLPMVLEAFCYADRVLIHKSSQLSQATIYVNFHSTDEALNRIEDWGPLEKFCNAGQGPVR